MLYGMLLIDKIINMNNVINKFLSADDKFMPEMHLRQPQFVYSACGPFTRHKERIKKFKQTGDTRYIYINELDKACFQHDSAYADHKDLINRTKSDKVLRDKAYDIASNPEYDGYQRGLASMVYKILKNKLYKHMTASGKNAYYDDLDDIVNEYYNTKHSTIKMKPKDVKNDNKRVYIDEHNEKDSRFKVGDRVRISKFKNIFVKGYTPNWSKEIFIVDKINATVPYTYNIKDLNDEEIIGSFYDGELQKSTL